MINKEDIAKMAVVAHTENFVRRIGSALRDFMEPLDPNECEEMRAYLESVARAVDNVVAVTLFVSDKPEALEQLEASTQQMLKNLSELHGGKSH